MQHKAKEGPNRWNVYGEREAEDDSTTCAFMYIFVLERSEH
jgi:hypothetical protein